MEVISGLHKIQTNPYVFEVIWILLVLAVLQSILSTLHKCPPSIHLVFSVCQKRGNNFRDFFQHVTQIFLITLLNIDLIQCYQIQIHNTKTSLKQRITELLTIDKQRPNNRDEKT